jgi:hypothetical protein
MGKRAALDDLKAFSADGIIALRMDEKLRALLHEL